MIDAADAVLNAPEANALQKLCHTQRVVRSAATLARWSVRRARATGRGKKCWMMRPTIWGQRWAEAEGTGDGGENGVGQ